MENKYGDPYLGKNKHGEIFQNKKDPCHHCKYHGESGGCYIHQFHKLLCDQFGSCGYYYDMTAEKIDNFLNDGTRQRIQKSINRS